MPIQKNLNVSPYYDDFDVDKNYYRVLYKAGYPIQARELSQQQSILQDQIEQFASRILKEGDNVVPGEFTYLPSIAYVRLSSFTRGASLSDFQGQDLVGASSGVKAKVILTADATDEDDATLFVSYTDSGTTSNGYFAQGEIIEVESQSGLTGVVGVNGISKPTTSNACGLGSLFKITEGSYFISGTIVRNVADLIPVEKYNDRPNRKVGFIANEEVVTSNDDPSLLDNSQGSSNFSAPGADRLRITLELTSIPVDSNTSNFISLATIQEGVVLSRPGNTVKWDWLYDLLARRTYDESGDYVVRDFPIFPLEYANTSTQDGVFSASPDTGLYPSSSVSTNTSGFTYEETEKYFAMRLNPGKAYVRGYEIEYNGAIYRYGEKARDTEFRDNTITTVNAGYSLPITSVYGMPDVSNISGDGNARAFDDVVLYRNFIDGFVGAGVDGNGRPLNMGNAPWITYHIIADDNIGATGFTEIYKSGKTAVVATNIPLARGSSIGGAVALIVTKIDPTPAGVMRPRFMEPNALIAAAGGDYYAYNSTYNLGILDTVYFTELDVVGVTNGTDSWTVGNKVTGELSGATGVVEEGSTPEQLIVSLVTGRFELGEEITEGDKVSRILRDGEISGFKFYDKGAGNVTIDLSSQTAITLSALGLELTLTVADGEIATSSTEITLLDAGREKLKNFPYPEGSELNTRINYDVVTTPSAVNGYAVTRAASTTNTIAKTKSFFSYLADTNDFSADISIQNSTDSEVTDVANSSLFSADSGSNILSCDNFNGDASTGLQQGDLVTFVDDNSQTINAIVDFATKPVGYGEQRSNSKIYLTTAVPNNVTGKTIQRIRVKAAGSAGNTLLMVLPNSTIKTLETNTSATSINYQVYREFIVNVAAGATTITLTTSKSNEAFLGDINKTSIIISENITTPSDPNFIEGRSLVPETIDTTQDSGRKIVYTLPSSMTASVTVKVIAPVYVTDAKAKRKIYRDNQAIVISQADAQAKTISLGKADVTKIYSIDQGGVDITANFKFDNGMRDNSYQISRLIRKDGIPAPVGDLTVTYAYFEHSGDGDFFSADSYTDGDGIGYRDIPTYFSTVDQTRQYATQKKIDPKVMYLRDCLDFRPIVNTDSTTGSVIPSITDGVDVQGATNFLDSSVGGNGFVPRMPIPNTPFQCDLEYYLPRIDSIFLQGNGKLTMVEGVPNDVPVAPTNPPESIRLYDLTLPPYTFDVKDIYIKKYYYKRYRMQDIAVIDRQVQNLTQVVALSLLEQDALNTQVRDAVTGLDRFKNGIVVDSFKDHSRGDYTREDYRCSIDPKSTHLRPPFFKDQPVLEEINSTDLQREGDGYVVNNGIATCLYEEKLFSEQPNATKWINCQPYFVFMYTGQLVLDPPIDTFEDITTLPDLVVEDDSLFLAMEAMFAASGGSFVTGTEWGAWSSTTSTSVSGPDRWSDAGGVQTTTQTTTSTQTGVQTSLGLGEGEEWVDTSLGDRVVNVTIAETCRSIPISFYSGGLKPNTQVFFFFDGIPVSEWCAADTIIAGTEFSDGKARYSDTVGEFPGTFGTPMYSDDVGKVQGVFILPNGRAPVEGSQWDGVFEEIQYQTEGETRSFNTGTRRVMVNSNSDGRIDPQIVETVAETDFVSSGVIMDVQETILSTRIAELETTTETVTQTQTSSGVTDIVVIPPDFPDPVAQTFIVDETNPDGMFVTSVDVYFRQKSETEGIRCYLTDTEAQVPTENVIPHSDVYKFPDTIVRVICTLGAEIDSETWEGGLTIVGKTSGATGTIKSSMVFASDSVNAETNVTNKVYDVILDNYLNDFIDGEEVVPQVTPASTSTFVIGTQQYLVSRADVKRTGQNYTTASVEFSAPQLPGGVTATADAIVFDGLVYDIKVTNPGSGYTRIPTITITGDGSGATAEVFARKGNPGVSMGISTSMDASAPTNFKFHAPVYLLGGDTWYSFVVRPGNSLDYEVFTTKIGEYDLLTGELVTTQATVGSLFMSQNGGLWDSDQTQDLKYKLYRAEFQTNATGTINMQNRPIRPIAVQTDPIETSALGTDVNSNAFGDNPKVIRVYSQFNGLAPGDLTSIDGVVNNPGGIPNEEINGVHRVIDADTNLFTIKVETSATASTKAGGPEVKVCPNRPFEVMNVYGGAMEFSTGKVGLSARTTQAAAVTGFNSSNAYRLDPGQSVKIQHDYYFDGPKQICNYLNEADHYEDLRDGRSLQVAATLMTLSPKTSPVLDLTRTNATVVKNLVNDPGTSDEIYGVNAQTLTFGGDISGAGLSPGVLIEFNDDGTNREVTVRGANNATSKVQVSGQYANRINTDTTFTNSTLNSAGLTSVSPLTVGDFVPETEDNGSVYAKWMSRMYFFEFPCDGIELKLASIFYDVDDIKVYYRPKAVGYDGDIAEVNWIPFNGDGSPNNKDLVTARRAKSPDPKIILPSDWQSLTWSVQDTAKFEGLAVKIVMTATNPAKVPLIDDMQLICTE